MTDYDIPVAFGTPIEPIAAFQQQQIPTMVGVPAQPQQQDVPKQAFPPSPLVERQTSASTISTIHSNPQSTATRSTTPFVRDLKSHGDGGSSATSRPRVMLPTAGQEAVPVSQDAINTLIAQGFTRALAESLTRNKLALPLRIWVVDNSGSMAIQDGHRMVALPKGGELRPVACTRWAELQKTAEYHAQSAALLQAPTVFRLLNDPGRVAGPQQFSVAEQQSQAVDADLAMALSTLQNTQPGGVTPLIGHLQEIQDAVVTMTPRLQSTGAKVAIVLATDGIPTDERGYSSPQLKKDFESVLRSFQGLPVWIVIRLCTDDESVVDFWNAIDSQLELGVEVLDDFMAEAEEIYEHNPWLNYGLPLHRMREMGFHQRVMDLIDQETLTKDQLVSFFTLLFGGEAMQTVPNPHVSWKDFCKAIGKLAEQEQRQWNPRTQRMEPWVDVRKLRRQYGNKNPLAKLFG